MTDPTDRLLAAVLERAGLAVAQEREYGRLVSKAGDSRSYEAQRDGCLVLTFTKPGSVLQYELVGLELGVLR